MLHLIQSNTDKFYTFLTEDPVRPGIPVDRRIGDNKEIFSLKNEDGSIKAITCVSYQDHIPTTEEELFKVQQEPNLAIFYTIWSYAPGAGRDLILSAVDHIKNNNPKIKRFITLSPPTDMAKRFHLKNGAIIFRTNQETVNYEYKVDHSLK